jgi:hypothetical protein
MFSILPQKWISCAYALEQHRTWIHSRTNCQHISVPRGFTQQLFGPDTPIDVVIDLGSPELLPSACPNDCDNWNRNGCLPIAFDVWDYLGESPFWMQCQGFNPWTRNQSPVFGPFNEYHMFWFLDVVCGSMLKHWFLCTSSFGSFASSIGYWLSGIPTCSLMLCSDWKMLCRKDDVC